MIGLTPGEVAALIKSGTIQMRRSEMKPIKPTPVSAGDSKRYQWPQLKGLDRKQYQTEYMRLRRRMHGKWIR